MNKILRSNMSFYLYKSIRQYIFLVVQWLQAKLVQKDWVLQNLVVSVTRLAASISTALISCLSIFVQLFHTTSAHSDCGLIKQKYHLFKVGTRHNNFKGPKNNRLYLKIKLNVLYIQHLHKNRVLVIVDIYLSDWIVVHL